MPHVTLFEELSREEGLQELQKENCVAGGQADDLPTECHRSASWHLLRNNVGRKRWGGLVLSRIFFSLPSKSG